MSRRPSLLARLAGAILLAALATPAAAAAHRAPSAFAGWLDGGDAGEAATRFRADAARDPRDPWPRLGLAMLAERDLDDEGEVDALLSIVEAAPRHPLAVVAIRRLGELALSSSRVSDKVDAALARALEHGLPGMAAYRARVVRAAAAENRGELDVAARLRAQNGSATEWAVAGPFGAFHALDLDRPFPPEDGAWLPRWERPGRAPLASRVLPAPEGAIALDGETGAGDVWYLAADARIARGGRFLLALGTTVSARVFVDGKPVAERRVWAGWPSAVQVVPVELSAGTHRVLVKLTRGAGRPSLALVLAREDGSPSEVAWSAAAGPGAAVGPGTMPRPLLSAQDLALALEPEAGPALARLVAARDRVDNDRQAAVAMLEEAVTLAPRSARIRAIRGDAISGDASQAERVSRARAEAEWREALKMDPADGAVRLVLAEVAIAGGRLDDAEALLAGLPEKAAARPRARIVRARLLASRSFPEAAEGMIVEASRDGSCAAAAILVEMASSRGAVALEDEAVEAFGRCPGGLEKLADERRARGDVAGSVQAWRRIVQAAPARLDARLSLVRALVAQGDAAAAAAELTDLSRLWPSDPRIQRRLADLLELAGKPVEARAARERALALDGADLGLRRALALDDGREVLADLADDGPATIREYEAAAIPATAPASLVLDAAAVEVYPDGTSSERTHQVIHVHDNRGVEKWGEVEIPPGAAILQLKTRKRDGRVLEPEEHGGDKRTLSAAGLEPGDYLEVEYMRGRPARGPASPGWAADPFFFRGEDLSFFRSTYAVSAPGGDLELDAKHMDPPPIRRVDGRDVMRAEARQVPALVVEPGAPGLSEYVPMVAAGHGGDEDGVALAAADALAERVRGSREIDALARAVRFPPGSAPLAGEALVRAAYEAVMQKVDGNGPLTDTASHVLSRGRGNRMLVLVALLDALGIPARVALVRPFFADPQPWRFPRLDRYGVVAVRAEAGGKVFWLDPSVRWAPFAALPPGARDAPAIVLPRPGETLRRERTPATLPDDRTDVSLRIEIDEDGDAVVEGVETYPGFEGAAAKGALEQVDASGRRKAVEGALSRSFRSARIEDVVIEGERRIDVPLVIRYRARVPGLARPAGGRLAIDAVPYPARLGPRLAPLATRESPLLLGLDESSRLRIEIVPPQGSVPAPAPAAELEAPQGRFTRSERLVDGRLVREDRLELRRARVAPEDYPVFARFAAAVDEAQGVPMDVGPARD